MNLSTIQRNVLPSFADRSADLPGENRWASQKSEGDFGVMPDVFVVGGAVAGAVGGAVLGARLEGPLAAIGLGAIGAFVGACLGIALYATLATASW